MQKVKMTLEIGNNTIVGFGNIEESADIEAVNKAVEKLLKSRQFVKDSIESGIDMGYSEVLSGMDEVIGDLTKLKSSTIAIAEEKKEGSIYAIDATSDNPEDNSQAFLFLVKAESPEEAKQIISEAYPQQYDLLAGSKLVIPNKGIILSRKVEEF